MNKSIKKYADQGFDFINGDPKAINELRSDFLRVFNEVSILNGAGEIRDDQDIISLYNGDNRRLWVAAYDQLRQLPGIYLLIDRNMLREIEEICEIGFSAYTSKITVRVDMPMGYGSTPTPAHQDYPTHQGSGNSVTLWIPLQDVTSVDGAIQVLPGSHTFGIIEEGDEVNQFTDKPGTLLKNDGLRGHLESSSHLDEQFLEVPMVAGQVLIFSTLLVHRSGVNIGNRIRYSLNIRLNDLADTDYAKRYYYLNETSSVITSKVDFDVRFPAQT